MDKETLSKAASMRSHGDSIKSIAKRLHISDHGLARAIADYVAIAGSTNAKGEGKHANAPAKPVAKADCKCKDKAAKPAKGGNSCCAKKAGKCSGKGGKCAKRPFVEGYETISIPIVLPRSEGLAVHALLEFLISGLLEAVSDVFQEDFRYAHDSVSAAVRKPAKTSSAKKRPVRKQTKR